VRRIVGTLARLAVWIATAAMGALAITQAFGVTGIPVVFVLQALTPFLLAPAIPLATIAALAGWHRMALVNVGVAAAVLWLSAPLAIHDQPVPATAGATSVTVAHANTYYRTDRPELAAATLLALDVDVLAITEYSWQFGHAFDEAGGAQRYPYEAVRSPGDRNGIALFSRYPIVDSIITPIGQAMAIDATVVVDGSPLRLVVVHPLPGTNTASLDTWERDLRAIDDAVDPDPATILFGDFNATRWHPAFRDLLDEGWLDVHESLGRGWSMSWPTDVVGPPFVRIDHALLGEDVSVGRVRDLDVPGSDHRAFVIDVALPAAG